MPPTSAKPGGEPEPAGKDSGGASGKQSSGARSKPPATKPRSRTKATVWPLVILLLVVAGAVAALGYFGWEENNALQARLAELDSQVDNQSVELQEISSAVDGVQQDARQAVQQAAEQVEEGQQQAQRVQRELSQQTRQMEEQVRALRRQLQAISTTTTEDWKLAEAYYLTRLAGQRLLMERDTGSALALLQAADEIVRNYPDPDLHPARAALADDIAALRLANDVDRQGLYLRIAALIRQIRELPVGEPRNFEPDAGRPAPADKPEASGGEPQRDRETSDQEPIDQEPSAQEPSAQEPSEQDPSEQDPSEQGVWASVRQSFHRAMDKLTNFVRVTRHDEPLQPVMTLDQQLYRASSLETTLDTAQLALLREQPEIYRASLQRARQLLTEVYAESRQRQALLAELRELEGTDIRQGLPDISESQQVLGNYLERRHRLAPQNGDRSGAQPQPAPAPQQSAREQAAAPPAQEEEPEAAAAEPQAQEPRE
ncbi:uroporphyrinogen-III C-methyltransferase [Gilvimarinus sp. F26214L]|uniref:uroporphyrinogen-III C-methyltransferase n=1 Tax=Gilvimarinus sp. DZF01 TaxID=3461371 RepID=UPI00404642CA